MFYIYIYIYIYIHQNSMLQHLYVQFRSLSSLFWDLARKSFLSEIISFW